MQAQAVFSSPCQGEILLRPFFVLVALEESAKSNLSTYCVVWGGPWGLHSTSWCTTHYQSWGTLSYNWETRSHCHGCIPTNFPINSDFLRQESETRFPLFLKLPLIRLFKEVCCPGWDSWYFPGVFLCSCRLFLTLAIREQLQRLFRSWTLKILLNVDSRYPSTEEGVKMTDTHSFCLCRSDKRREKW